MITKAAIEAAAQAMSNSTGADNARTDWHAESEHYREHLRTFARAALEAAAPHMLAPEYDRGFEDGYRAGYQTYGDE